MILAERIRKIRICYHLSQSEVANRCGISSSAYGQIERKAGRATFETLERIAEALGVSLPFLVDIKSDSYFEEKNKL